MCNRYYFRFFISRIIGLVIGAGLGLGLLTPGIVLAQQQVSTFTLVNADTDQDIQLLADGATLNLSALPTRNINVRANTNPATVGSVVFDLTGVQSRYHIESVAPYALFSDSGGDYAPWTPVVGSYTLQATPYDVAGGGGVAGTVLIVNFTVVDAPAPGPYTLSVSTNGSGTVSKTPDQATYPTGTSVSLLATPTAGFQFIGWTGSDVGTANPLTISMNSNKSITATFGVIGSQQVTALVLVNADNDQDIQTITSGSTLDLSSLPTRNLNVRATTSPDPVGSVVFELSGAETQIQTETTPPYALFSDSGGDFNPWTPTVGNYTLQATPYDAAGGTGVAGTALSISFTVADTPSPGPHTLIVNTIGSGTVSKTPNQATYVNGTSVTLLATPSTGYQFAGWSGGATGLLNPLTLTMTNNKNITATFTVVQQVSSFTLINADTDQDLQTISSGSILNLFTLPTRNLNIRANTAPDPVGSVVFTLSGAESRNHTESTAPYALFSDIGGDFNAWTPTLGSYTLLGTPYNAGGGTGSSGTSLSVSFTVVDQPGPFSLNINTVGSGTVNKSPDQVSYSNGTTVTLTATPGSGYQFTGWSGDASGSTNPLTVTMSGNLNITATFATQPQKRILFVGNSFTNGKILPVLPYNAAAITDENYGLAPGDPRYENEPAGPGPWGGLPGIFKKLADEAGLDYLVHIEAINNSSLQMHHTSALSIIQQARWDRVVLQEQSTQPLPVSRTGQPDLFVDYATRLQQAIHAANPLAKIYLFQTWARADMTYPVGSPYQGLPIDSMTQNLHQGYYRLLTLNGRFTAVAPVGDAWLHTIKAGLAMADPYAPTPGLIDLWAADNVHASKWGSYLSACVLFYQITGVDPRSFGNTEQAALALGISAADMVNLQRMAYEQVQAAFPSLPVSLTSFTANRVSTGVQLRWHTASEQDNAGFTVERSLDGKAFAALSQVEGHGTTNLPQAYAWADIQAPAARLYYRLRQQDLNGKTAFSPVVVVSPSAAGSDLSSDLALFPNPAGETLHFATGAATAYRILTPLGKSLLQGTTEKGGTTVDVHSLSPGFYLLEVSSLSSRVVRKFVKE
jgi:uncharacterized repeat protein (TIGR02543 family)